MWEYNVIENQTFLKASVLDHFGRDCWELVNFAIQYNEIRGGSIKSFSNTFFCYVFKRKIELKPK